MTETSSQSIDMRLDAEIVADSNSGWACVVVPDSKRHLGTGMAVKISGTIDDEPFEATMLPIGDGQHMVPVKATVRKAIGKSIGDSVHLTIDTKRS